ELRYFKYNPPIYPQLWGDFLANLSVFDLVLNCGPKARDILLRHQREISSSVILREQSDRRIS
ncbi:MAG TPA: WbqC family protein, partial [Desulfobaccales bacterium]|nr:WbqC family protein [Desulfobaccales bacterium]